MSHIGNSSWELISIESMSQRGHGVLFSEPCHNGVALPQSIGFLFFCAFVPLKNVAALCWFPCPQEVRRELLSTPHEGRISAGAPVHERSLFQRSSAEALEAPRQSPNSAGAQSAWCQLATCSFPKRKSKGFGSWVQFCLPGFRVRNGFPYLMACRGFAGSDWDFAA